MKKLFIKYLLLSSIILLFGCSDIKISNLHEILGTQGRPSTPLWINDTCFVFTQVREQKAVELLMVSIKKPNNFNTLLSDTGKMLGALNYTLSENRLYINRVPFHINQPNVQKSEIGYIVLDEPGYSFNTVTIGPYFWSSVSPNGQWLLFSEPPDREDWTAVWKKNLVNGETTLFVKYRSLNPIFSFWSWDSKKVLLEPTISYPDDVRLRLKIVDAQNPELIYVDKDIDALYPCWSPNGNNILFTEFHGSEDTEKRYSYLWNVSLSKRRVSRVVKLLSKIVGSPAFSPDGKKIALVRYSFSTKSTSIWIADVKTNQ